MRVLITGATGFIGGALARALAQAHAEVHALARTSSDRSVLSDIPIIWHVGDITHSETLRNQFNGMQAVVCAAGKLGQAGVPEAVYQHLHVEGIRNVLNEIQTLPESPRVLYVSSPGVLGPTGRVPLAEDASCRPSNMYERSKAAGEQVAKEFASQGLPVIIVRPEFVYGPGDYHVLRLFQNVQNGRFFYIDGGAHLCHPTFIEDVVQGLLLSLAKGSPGEIYHIAGPQAVTFRELVETMARAMGCASPKLSLPRSLAQLGAAGMEVLGGIAHITPPLGRDGVAFFGEDRTFSWQKAHNELGYSPRYDLSAGIARTVAWYRQREMIR
jgi:nucleoside-diphosphate-sugar epimerase